jgi:outer membrane protein assembly factor BamB
MMASFLYVKPCVYTTTDNGSFSCFNAETGEFLWQKRLGGSLNPSPLYADGKFYLFSEQGVTSVLKPHADPTQEPELLSKNELEEEALASIAVTGNGFLIRTTKHLWCVRQSVSDQVK